MFNMDPGKWLPALPLFGSLVCVYCGGPADTTHNTPPLCLLPKPWPGNVQAMTVPACSKCNGEFSQDEMRTAAAQAVCLCANAALKRRSTRVADHPPRAIRELRRGSIAGRLLSARKPAWPEVVGRGAFRMLNPLLSFTATKLSSQGALSGARRHLGRAPQRACSGRYCRS